MRIIAGKFRGRRLQSPPSQQTRPTSDRLRETLFNILAARIEGARFLDLCAGTGAVGIEALSRGAQQVTFVDQSRKLCALIEANTSTLNIADSDYEIIAAEANEFVRKRGRNKSAPFDIVFFDPPYAADYKTVLEYVGQQTVQLLGDNGLVIVEHSSRTVLNESFGELTRSRLLKQADSSLSFYERHVP